MKKLVNYAKSKNLAIELIKTDIVSWENCGNNTARCRVRCVFCNIYGLCNYNSHWRVSNYESHLLSHLKTIESNKNSSGTTSGQDETPGNPSKIQISINPELDPELAELIHR